MIKKSLFIIILGGLVSILISCFPTEHLLIVGIRFNGVEEIESEIVEGNKYFLEILDTMRHKLFFEIEYETEFQYRASLIKFSFNSLYATTVPEVIDNYIVMDSLELFFDKEVYIGGDTIFAGEDLWNHPQVANYKWTQESDGYATFGFENDFYEKVIFPRQQYIIRLKCYTNDNKHFHEVVEYYLDI